MRWGRLLILLGATLVASNARAQDVVPSLDLRNFQVSTDPAGSLALEPASTPGAGNWNVGAYASYARDSVVLATEAGDERAVVEHQISVDYLVNLGIGSRLALGLVLPTIVYQSGDAVGDLLPGATELPQTTFGDLTLAAKATLLSPSDLGGFGVAAIGHFSAPTGDASGYAGEESVRGDASLLGELSLLAIAARVRAGARFRGAPQTYVDDGTDDYRFGHDLPWAAGLMIRPQAFGLDNRGRFRWYLEARGAIALTPELAAGPQSPVSFGASVRYTVDEVSAFTGVELPLNSAVGNPLIRPVIGVGWAPRFEDSDEDGIGDEEDECPELAEDRDGFQDTDGCPDFDNDDDGVPDEEDRCPKELEDADEFQDEDGCPDPDNDGDGVPDAEDACPNESGPRTGGPKTGCRVVDTDGDGVLDSEDRCPTEPEDLDAFEDEDGCPDLDNDRDGVPDVEDECRDQSGQPRPETPWHGCPSPDRDGDTFDDTEDKCPDEPEDFDGTADEDGCPDPEGARALVTVDTRGAEPSLLLAKPIRFKKDALDPASESTVRAIAQLLNAHDDWIVAVGVRPANATAEAAQEALNRSFAVALALRAYTHRDSAAESLSFSAVASEPLAQQSGVGLLLLVPRPADAAPATKP